MPTDKNIKTPDELYELFKGYKVDCKFSPKMENYYSAKRDKEVSVSREVPFTWDGFEIWLRSKKILARLDDYKYDKDQRYTEYAYIIHAIGQEIFNDKFSGAVVGIYKENIIARDLGLAEKKITDNVHEIKDFETWASGFRKKG